MTIYIECCSVSTPNPPYIKAIECDCEEKE
jgi:hypothetical protein